MSEFSDPDDWRNFRVYLAETNRFALSPYWESFLRNIRDTASKRTVTVERGARLVRARIGTRCVEFGDGGGQPSPIPPKEMGAPPKELARAGRLNPEGIPYLYLATNDKTAVSELRPWVGADISIGYFEINDSLTIVDTSQDKPTNRWLDRLMRVEINGKMEIVQKPVASLTPQEKEQSVWGDINKAFSTPVSPNATSLRYLATQYLAEMFKSDGYDGVAYKSSLSDDGYNLAIFCPDKARCTASRMFDLKKITYVYEESGNPAFSADGDTTQYLRVEIIGPAPTSQRSPDGP